MPRSSTSPRGWACQYCCWCGWRRGCGPCKSVYPTLPGRYGLADPAGDDSNMTKLLMIEDDVRLAGMVSDYLAASGYEVSHAPDATSGLERLQHTPPELVILDLMLPDMDGLQVCQRIRGLPGAAGQVPVLMLTAKGDPMDRIIGLEMGADDYLPKPFEPRELLARLRAILRRRSDHRHQPGLAPIANPELLRFGRLEIDPAAHAARIDGQPCELTAYQFDLLLVLAQHAGRVLSRDSLMEQLKGET